MDSNILPLPSNDAPILEWAKFYYALGWSIIPADPITKKPRLEIWKPYQTERPPITDLHGWFSGTSATKGLAVICGAVSGNLAALDFDSPEVYEWFKATHPDLAGILPTERTTRGFHVYFRCEPTATQKPKGQKVELLSQGAYVIVTPSAGKCWLYPPDGEILQINPFALGLERFGITPPGRSHVTEETEESEDAEEAGRNRRMASGSSDSSESSGSSVSSGSSDDLTGPDENVQRMIDEAIAATMPPATGERNRCLFTFARWLKGIPELRDLPAKDLRPIVQRWHARAYPNISTKAFDESWADFVYAWKRVKWARGTGPQFEAAVEKATNDTETPPEASRYADPRTQKLIRVCYQLQQLDPGNPFYLSVRKAGEVAGFTPAEAGKMLEMLQADGLLAIAKAHTAYRATRYRYLGRPGGAGEG